MIGFLNAPFKFNLAPLHQGCRLGLHHPPRVLHPLAGRHHGHHRQRRGVSDVGGSNRGGAASLGGTVSGARGKGGRKLVHSLLYTTQRMTV